MGRLADKLYEKSTNRQATNTIKGAEIRAAIIELEQNAFEAASAIARFAKDTYDLYPWKNREARQAYLDCLHIMQRHGIIDDFSIVRGVVTKEGREHQRVKESDNKPDIAVRVGYTEKVIIIKNSAGMTISQLLAAAEVELERHGMDCAIEPRFHSTHIVTLAVIPRERVDEIMNKMTFALQGINKRKCDGLDCSKQASRICVLGNSGAEVLLCDDHFQGFRKRGLV